MIKPYVKIPVEQVRTLLERQEYFGTHQGMMFTNISREDLLKKLPEHGYLPLSDYMGFSESGSDGGIAIVVSGIYGQPTGVKLPLSKDEIQDIVTQVVNELPEILVELTDLQPKREK